MIHPFLDDNGRMGRMLIPLFLHQNNCTDEPVFYMSEYFEKNRHEYYAKLNVI
jgi:Fic family protein